MSSESSGSTGQWLPKRPSKRHRLQAGTFIIPSTGQRSRQNLTLRTSTLRTRSDDSSPTSFHAVLSPEHVPLRERALALAHNVAVSFILLRDWLLSPNGKSVLKCSLAYLLGTTATFWGPLSDFLGNRDGKHIVATITVYFHPARTVGSMLEAILISCAAVLYAQTISFAAMGTSVLFTDVLGVADLSRLISLVLYIGGGLGFVGWVKQKYASPLVNVASTLGSIAIIGCITKEADVYDGDFGTAKIEQVLKMLLLGITITSAVNMLIWRSSARKTLRISLSEAVVSLGDKLSIISRGFLAGSEDELRSDRFAVIEARYDEAHATVSKSVRESKFEYYVLGRERQYHAAKAIVASIEKMSQAVGGLRTACDTQFVLMRETSAVEAGLAGINVSSPRGSLSSAPPLGRSMSSFLRSIRERPSALDSISELAEPDHTTPVTSPEPISTEPGSYFPTVPAALRMPSEIFEVFIMRLGPSMKSLAFTLSEILREPPFAHTGVGFIIASNDNFKTSLGEALSLYDQARAGALEELYESIELEKARSEAVQADIEEVAAACNHFSYSLKSVGGEIEAYLDAVEDYRFVVDAGVTSWEWLRFWRHLWALGAKVKAARRKSRGLIDDVEGDGLLPQQPATVQRLRKTAVPRGIPDEMLRRRDNYSWDAAPGVGGWTRKVSQRMLSFLRFLGRDDILFGIKVGIGAIIWAAFAFTPQTRPFYNAWRGEWGLLSYMIVVATTLGASNTTSLARFQGTVFGAAAALCGWLLSDGDVYLLAFFCWLMSLYNSYLTFEKGRGQLARMTLLTWNVTVLYAYSLAREQWKEDDDDLDEESRPLIFHICYHRFMAVTMGILWGMVVCRVIWPLSGRKKFREGVSVLYLQLGLIWRRGPLAVLLKGENPRYLKEGEQAALRRYASKLDSLRTAAEKEFSLRGPFPKEPYARIMASTTRILDGFHAMSIATNRRVHLSPGERALLRLTAPERALLCDRICHVCQVVASSIMLEYPLTDSIPVIEGVKDRLLGKVYNIRRRQAELLDRRNEEMTMTPGAIDDVFGIASPGGGGGGMLEVGGGGSPRRRASVLSGEMSVGFEVSDEELEKVTERDFALLYIYILLSARVADELRMVIREIEGLFGVLSDQSLLLQ